MSILTYNSVTAGPDGWLTLQFTNEAVMDPSGTDMECMKLAVSGHCYLTSPWAPMSAVNNIGKNPAEALPTLRLTTKFMEQRRSLSFKINGVELVPSTSTVDARNGPHPLRFNVLEITERAFLVDLAIESHWAEGTALSEGGVILSHRWREESLVDRHFLTKKSRKGRIAVSSATFNSSSNKNGLDNLRDTLTNCSIPKGFIRMNSRYTVEESGLVMGYEHQDEEQFRMCPDGSTEADGEMAVTTQRQGSPGRMQTCWVMLRGPKKVESEPAKLIKTAIAICYSKLRLNGGFFPIKAEFKEKLWRNEVFVALTGFCKTPLKLLDLQDSLKGFGKVVPLQIGERSPNPGSRGTAELILHAAAYHDPTLAQALNQEDNTVNPVPGRNQPVPTTSRAGMIPGG